MLYFSSSTGCCSFTCSARTRRSGPRCSPSSAGSPSRPTSSTTSPPPDGTVSFPALPPVAPSPHIVTIPPFESVRSPEWKEFTATAYCLRGITRTGTRTRPGTLAVDPAVIPFGSILEVSAGPYSGIYYALDSGGLVKGPKVDIYIKTHRGAIQFGRRKVLLRVLRPGWGEDTPASLERDALAVRSAELRP